MADSEVFEGQSEVTGETYRIHSDTEMSPGALLAHARLADAIAEAFARADRAGTEGSDDDLPPA